MTRSRFFSWPVSGSAKTVTSIALRDAEWVVVLVRQPLLQPLTQLEHALLCDDLVNIIVKVVLHFFICLYYISPVFLLLGQNLTALTVHTANSAVWCGGVRFQGLLRHASYNMY